MLKRTPRYWQASHTHPSSWAAAAVLTLTLLLSACGGADSGTPAPQPLRQQGFGPSQLYDPIQNPGGRILREGDTGVVFLKAASAASAASSQQAVWFEIASAASYEFLMEEEDLAVLESVEVQDSLGARLLRVDTVYRSAQVTLPSGRYALRLHASPAIEQSTPLFIRFDDDNAAQVVETGAAKQIPKPRSREVDSGAVRSLLRSRHCYSCPLSGADLSGQDLRGMEMFRSDLSGANLAGAQLTIAAMQRVNLTAADLSGAFMQQTDLKQSNLSRANLSGAILNVADLREADLSEANLTGTNLQSSDLRNANLTGANLSRTRLFNVNLSGANLSRTDLSSTDLSYATWIDGRVCGRDSIGVCK